MAHQLDGIAKLESKVINCPQTPQGMRSHAETGNIVLDMKTYKLYESASDEYPGPQNCHRLIEAARVLVLRVDGIVQAT